MNKDAAQFRAVIKAMDTIEISKEHQDEIFDIIASILHIGNVKFSINEKGNAEVSHGDSCTESISKVCNIYDISEHHKSWFSFPSFCYIAFGL